MINIEEVKKIAKLSKLEFSDENLKEIQKSMGDILEHVEILNEVNVENIEPLYNVNEIQDIMREDIEENTVDKKDFLANSPNKDEDYIIVPKIV